MNAKFLKIVLILVVTGGLNLVAADRSGGSSVLRTTDGRVFYVTELVKVDPNGLLFRHRNGIAKVTFDRLDAAMRKEFGYNAAEAQKFEQAHKKARVKTRERDENIAAASSEPELILEIKTTTRTRVPKAVPPYCGDSRTLPFAYYPMAPWYSHWSRYQPAHILATYPYRHWAQHDLLRHSGFLPCQRRGAYIRY